ncbi:hypothetical protein BGX30_004402 [Mortierella sp. GBA39]|nr:hypothetical protein BGX30_004402 [Mortierella sp. GBA39]
MIKDDILARIENHQFEYDKPICTEKSLSEQYGVSRITSKRAIEDLEQAGILYRKRGVGSFVRRIPLSAQPESSVSSLPDGLPPGRTIPVILPFAVNQGGFFRIVEAATARLDGANVHLAIHICEPDPDKMRSLLLRLFAQDVDTLILYPAGNELHLDVLRRFTEQGKQVIILDKPHDIPYLSSVVCDNFGGSYQLTRHLYVKFNVTPDYHMLKHIINGFFRSGVTAIECENDEVAFNVYMCCLGLSIRVPEQMSITGFDNIEWAVTGSAQITTIDQNFSVIGETIADLILNGDRRPVITTVPVSLVPRASTGPATAD